MKQDKFLTRIIIGIVALVAIALLVFFTRQETIQDYQAEDQPRGVVFNYLLALDKGEYEKAYGYIADIPGKPTLTQFRQSMAINKAQYGTAVDVSEQTIDGQTAYVNVVTVMSGGGLFNEGYRNIENATLEKVGGEWRIISMPYAFWSYEWNQPEIK
ncbi:MAG: hypothetical protein K8R77_14605 [Anaerolineaceae bacterium]|nr:hypothetical protein [Anaerolineaceae bacterium]